MELRIGGGEMDPPENLPQQIDAQSKPHLVQPWGIVWPRQIFDVVPMLESMLEKIRAGAGKNS